jgi:hypothetical protein
VIDKPELVPNLFFSAVLFSSDKARLLLRREQRRYVNRRKVFRDVRITVLAKKLVLS